MADRLGEHLLPKTGLTERELLLAYLDRQRALLLWKLDGLGDEAAAQATPSGLTITGIVAHVTGVERGWLVEHFAGEPKTRDRDGELQSTAPLANLLEAFRTQTEVSDAVIAAHDLDDVAALDPSQSLRWLVLHLVEEISRHVGHLDLLAELADGRTGEEPD